MPIATPTELAARQAVIERSPTLGRLADRLRAQLDPLLTTPLFVPPEKALLSRDGGVCPHDGARLAFDPFSPHQHACPRCARTTDGEAHYRAWLVRYHLWLSERALHLALLGALRRDRRLQDRSREILQTYARLYPGYPNQDNVLGPSRLFFSTYLESIWLIQCVLTGELLEAGGFRDGLDEVRGMVRESAGLVAEFEEAWSNRQVWNNTALIAAGGWTAADALVDRGVNGPHGIRRQLERVPADGFWFEGENYHFFALRGLQLVAEILRGAGAVSLPLAGMYLAPLISLLPDLTLPARSDSPYGVSVRQPRFAELWELGWSRTGETRLASLLRVLYAEDLPDGPDYGIAEVAEVEQNRIPARLHRDRLGWKALLWMQPEAPPAGPDWQGGSALSAEHGLAVLRNGSRYASVECGGRPGGHGHPDLLHLTLHWGAPWLMDPGTGSYVSSSLFWYRSTLAHNAPGRAGVGQLSRKAWCSAFDQQGEWSWCRCVAPGLVGDQTEVRRIVITGPEYLVDLVEVDAPGDVTTDLALHLSGLVERPEWKREAASLRPAAGAGHETGYQKLERVEQVRGVSAIEATGNGSTLHAVLGPANEQVFLATAPGPPDLNLAETGPVPFLLRRATGSVRWLQVLARTSVVTGTDRSNDEVVVSRADGPADRILLRESAVEIHSGSRTHRLGGTREPPARFIPEGSPPLGSIPAPLLDRVPPVERWEAVLPPSSTCDLGEWAYRRSETPYSESAIRARAGFFATPRGLGFAVTVLKAELCFRAADAPDPRLDNETPDIHSDGVQCYLDYDGWQGYLLIPEKPGPAVRVRPVAGTAAQPERVQARWSRTAGGYRLVALVELTGGVTQGARIPVNLVVNEMRPGRIRRAGQLALSGGGWVYLRGDRESPASALVAEIR